MKTYFLSYARADGKLALRFADDLIAAGVSVWVDQYDIRPSQHWDRTVETAVRACQGLIVMLSPRSAASPNVADEVAVGIGETKTIIPILIEKCTPPLRMTRMQFIDATADYEGALKKCLTAIAEQAGAAPPAAPARESARLPAEELASAERRLIGLMGPIAAVLVRQASARATKRAELYDILSASIADPADRESFLGWAVEAPGARPSPRSEANVVEQDDAADIAHALVRHLGPIAAQLVRRESAQAASRADLCQRLAARIPDERDRAAFLKDVGADPLKPVP